MARQRYLRRCVASTRFVAVVVVVAASVSFSKAPANRWTDSAVYFMFLKSYDVSLEPSSSQYLR